MMKIIWVATALSLFPLTIWYYVLFKKTLSHLEKRHPEIWRSLGEIGFVKNNNIINSNKFIMFLLRKEYKALDDSNLNKDATLCRVLLISGFILATIAFVTPIIIGKYS